VSGWEWTGLVQTRRLGNPRHKAVLMFLANAAAEDGSSWWSTDRIAAATDVGARATRDILTAFDEQGLLTRTRRRGEGGHLGTYTYTLEWDAIAALPWNGITLRGVDGDPFAQVGTSGTPGATRDAPPAPPVVPRVPLASGTPGVAHNPSSEPQPLGSARGQLTLATRPPVPAAQHANHDLAFEAFWSSYPRKAGKKAARRAWDQALRRGADVGAVVAGARAHAADPNRDDAYTKHPATWLNGDCWEDPPLPARRRATGMAGVMGAAAEALAYLDSQDSHALGAGQ